VEFALSNTKSIVAAPAADAANRAAAAAAAGMSLCMAFPSQIDFFGHGKAATEPAR
jgi:hypothetical protein